MKFNIHGISKTDCKAGNHTDVITKTCGNTQCDAPTHLFCNACGNYVGNKVGREYLD